ncbi:MAG: hypothetical protein Q9223_003849 [Gallowayella weberi]
MASPSSSRHSWTGANDPFFVAGGAKISMSNSPKVYQNEGSASENSASEPKKRQTPQSITLNACTECKKARTKCDGGRPNCARCLTRQVHEPCEYVLHTKAAKQEMISVIRQLQEENRQLKQQNKSLSEKNDILETIFRSLKDDTQRQDVIIQLQLEDDYQRIVERLGQNPAVGQTLAPELGVPPMQFYPQYSDDIAAFPQYWQPGPFWNPTDMSSGG